MRQTEATPDQTTVAEQLTHLFWRGVGGDVKVLGLFTQQQVANATAHQIGFIARFIQAVEHLQGIFANVFARDVMALTRDNGHLMTLSFNLDGRLLITHEDFPAKISNSGKNGTPRQRRKVV